MTRGKAAIFLAGLIGAMALGTPTVKADDREECSGTPFDAVMRLPPAIGKWGQVACTPFGHVLESRDGWVWAAVDSGSDVLISSQIASRTARRLGNESYFTAIRATQLSPREAAAAASLFNEGLTFEETGSTGYRVDLTTASGATNTLYFFDFGTFAGAMACPGDECDPETRFLIMERETKPPRPGI